MAPLQQRTGQTRRERAGEMATAGGLTVITASLVGAVVAASRAIRHDPVPRSGTTRRGPQAEAETEHRAGGPIRSPDAKTAPSPDSPSKPDGPEDLHRPTWTYALKKTVGEFGSDDCTTLAAGLVYYAVLALGPGLVAVVSILGLLSPQAVSQLTDQLLAPVQQSSPGTYRIIDQLITNAARTPGAGVALLVGVLGALWSASGYVGAFGKAMNRIYDREEGRPVWRLRPTQLLVTVAIVTLVVVGGLLLVSAGPVVEHVADVIGVGPVAYAVFQIARWPVLVALAVAGVAILYAFAPNVRQPRFKWVSTGSFVALVVWAIATAGLGIYLSLSGGGSYARSYGPIAGVVIFLLWLWITNLALLFGAEFDAELERSRELQAGIPAEVDVQLPPKDTRQSDKKEAKRLKVVEQARRLRETRGRDIGT